MQKTRLRQSKKLVSFTLNPKGYFVCEFEQHVSGFSSSISSGFKLLSTYSQMLVADLEAFHAKRSDIGQHAV